MDVAPSSGRWLYRGRHPYHLARVMNRAWAGLAAAGIGPGRLASLGVEGRRAGRPVCGRSAHRADDACPAR